MKQLFLAVALLFAAPAVAQTAPNAGQPAPASPNPGQFADVAMQLARAIDANQAVQIWDSASPVMKQATPRDRFAATVKQRLALNGQIQGRDWYSISRATIAAGKPSVPAGEYLTVALAGVNKNGAVIRETISFILDADKVWRLAGYTVQ